MKDKKKLLFTIILVILILAIGSVAVALTISGQKNKPARGNAGTETSKQNDDIIEYNGVKYAPKKNIETYLFMGIDNDGKARKATEYGTQGRCDVVMVLVRDISSGTFCSLTIDRNTVVEQDSLALDNTVLSTSPCVLALAHENGDGMEGSAENVVRAVSNFLGGVEIDGYAALNMGAVSILNHAVDGVTITLEEDLTMVDEAFEKGARVHLSDEQAFRYVRARMGVTGSDTNQDRMRRQSVYMKAFKEKIKAVCASDEKKALEIYESLEEYMVTNVSKSKFTKLAYIMSQDKEAKSVTIQGTFQESDLGYTEMIPDEDSLQQAILELFYEEI